VPTVTLKEAKAHLGTLIDGLKTSPDRAGSSIFVRQAFRAASCLCSSTRRLTRTVKPWTERFA
jgi:hypothetical protein